MRVIKVRNVNQAIAVAGPLLSAIGLPEPSRNGPVRVAPEPVCTVYRNPTERVLFWAPRRANPFFHLFESMWMLAGRRDAGWLDRYVADFGARFAETDGTLHGAYGWRWRRHFRLGDQLRTIVDVLRRDPTTRRAVLQMWDADADLGTDARDIPCNTHVMFRVGPGGLDATVLCRSNDVVWGAYGANAVHMSVLQEYVATAIDVQVGQLRQVSNNFHIYDSTAHLFPMTTEAALTVEDPYSAPTEPTGLVRPTPLFRGMTSRRKFDADLADWMDDPSEIRPGAAPVFRGVLVPMSVVHDAIRDLRYRAALEACDDIDGSDWRRACREVVLRRMAREEEVRS